MNRKKEQNKSKFLFEKKNYLIMTIGLVFIALGFILMSGGGSNDPEVFNEAMYNFRRIRLAPSLVLLGLAIEIYAIMTKSKK